MKLGFKYYSNSQSELSADIKTELDKRIAEVIFQITNEI